MTTQILWRDACAMSKNLRKQFSARAHTTPLSDEESLAVVQAIQPTPASIPQPNSPLPAPHSREPTFATRPPKSSPVPGGLLLGTTKGGFLRSRKQEAWLTEQGLLSQVELYGCTGSGRTEILLAMALNAADPRARYNHWSNPKPRNVLFMDGYGDVGLFAKTLSGLTERMSAGNLRVINLTAGDKTPEQLEQGFKVSHSLDLFDGFDEGMLARWLIEMVPESLLGDPGNEERMRQMMPVVARLAVAFARQQKQRITLSVLAGLMTHEEALDHAQNLDGEHGHLACQWVAHNWGEKADPLRASLLKLYANLLSEPFKGLEHVFESDHPEVSLARLHDPKSDQSYVLVMAPAMEKCADHYRMLTRSIVTSFRLALEKRPAMEQCDTLAIFNEFDYCLEPADIKPMVRLQNRGCGVVWAGSEPSSRRRGHLDLFEWAGVESGTHVMMHQCHSSTHGGHFNEPYMAHQRQKLPGFEQLTAEKFNALNQGQAFLWSNGAPIRLEMDYIPTPRLRSYFLAHSRFLPPADYAFSSARLVHLDNERQARVLQERYAQWQDGAASKAPAPALSWCQETVARMLGFANWHEAHQALGSQAPS